MIDILSLTLKELEEMLLSKGYEKYRAKQIFSFLYKQNIDNFNLMTALKKDMRKQLSEEFFIYSVKIRSVSIGNDGAKKYLFELLDGALIESVLIPMDDGKFTICVSTQVGCTMGCKFCATGRMGFKRNLTASEIVEQTRYILKDNGLKIANIVYMGMGEPLDNYDNTVKSMLIMMEEFGLGISKRRMTLSTCGILPSLKQLKKDLPYINLAFSLHSAISEKRSMIMPINEKYPLEDVLRVLKDFPIPRRRRITFEYVMIKGLNDTREDAKALINIMSNLKSKLNLIPLNKHDLIGTKFEPTSMNEIEKFAQRLRNKGIFVTIRKSKGSDINAACGMLATTKAS